jgi:phage major head subunit gpT-like protein
MIIRGNFSDFYLSTMLPALNSVIWNRYNQYPEQYSEIFRVETSTRSIEQYGEVSGVGLFLPISEGEPVRYDQGVQGFNSTFTHSRFGLGVKFSQDVIEDDKIGLVTKQHKELARSSRETLEIAGASTFNNGFSGSFLGPDGVPLFSASHPLVKSGGVQNNLSPPQPIST